jgi:biopolymer transport protein TolR
MRAFAQTDEAVLSEINITPFTDVLLVLLIIFMLLAALVVPPGFEKRMDNCNCKQAQAKHTEPLVVTVRPDGVIFVGTRRTDERGIYAALESAVASNLSRPIQLVEDTKSPYRLAIRVLDAAKAAGASNVTLVSQ